MVAGLAAGAVLGVIFSPEKVSKSRKNLSKKGEELANALERRIDEKFEELISRVSSKVKTHPENEPVPSRKNGVV